MARALSLQPFFAGAALSALAACGPAMGQSAEPAAMHPNSVQPETTLSVIGTGEVNRAPDLATISAGVRSEEPTAREALAENSEAMRELVDTLKEEGIEAKDIQTGNFSVNAVYDYIDRPRDGEPRQRLRGYQVSNTVNVRVRDLDNLGSVLDRVVEAGGNDIGGLQFGLSEPRAAQDEARIRAVEDARAKADLYADAAGLEVVRVITMNESGGSPRPQPMMAQARMMNEAAPMAPPIEGGELGITARINVTYELAPR